MGKPPFCGIFFFGEPLPTLRSHVATQVVSGKIYAIGGWDRQEGLHVAFASVAVYDPATDMWTKRADVSTPRWLPASAVVHGKIFVIGGTAVASSGSQHNLHTVEVYDPETDTWTHDVDMPTARGWLSASVVDRKLYAIGGGLRTPPNTSEPVVLSKVEAFIVLAPD